jgi:hypothetical protein
MKLTQTEQQSLFETADRVKPDAQDCQMPEGPYTLREQLIYSRGFLDGTTVDPLSDTADAAFRFLESNGL